MIDTTFERISELELELLKLDTAYHVGSPERTLINLGVDVSGMTKEDMFKEYVRIADRIFEIQSILNVDNCQ